MTRDVRGGLKRDLTVTTIVTGAHTTNHFLQLVLPPLFPLLKVTYDVSHTDLGLLMALFYVASGLCQTPAGFLVDVRTLVVLDGAEDPRGILLVLLQVR